jgi:hypothetical protein
MNKDTLSRYRLLERISAGGMGEVWKAHDGLDRIVAVKMLLRGALGPLSNDAGRERFRREALTLSRLSHPGIATVFDFDSEGDHEFLVMEFVPGGTLESRLRESPLPLVQVQSLGAAVADALEDAHRHGVLYRDLKPGNVALTTEGRPKILDFGLALLLSGDAVTGRLTQAGTVMGSLAYIWRPNNSRARKKTRERTSTRFRSGLRISRLQPATLRRRGAFSTSSRRREGSVSSRHGESAPCTRVLVTSTRRIAGWRLPCRRRRQDSSCCACILDWIRFDPTRATGHSSAAWVSTMAAS